MKGKKIQIRPTDSELAILQILWEHGPSTVRTVHELMRDETGTGYTTVLKTMQIMAEKGLVNRDEGQRAHIYDAALREEDAQRDLMSDLVNRAYRGSAGRMVMQALSNRRASKEEIEEIRHLLDEMSEESE